MIITCLYIDLKYSFVGPETESDSKIQQDLLDSEINKNPDAIAFAAVTGDFTEQIKRIKEIYILYTIILV